MSAPHEHSATCGCSEAAKQQQQFSSTLFPAIDLDKVYCLNENEAGQGKRVFRPHEQRHQNNQYVQSPDDDPELLIFVPFTSNVKIVSFCIRASGDTAPDKLNIFVNRDDIDLSSAADTTPSQSFQLQEDDAGEIDYPVKIAKFGSCSSLLLHFPSSFGGEQTQIEYIAFKGVQSGNRREIVNVVYESRANPADHQKLHESAAGAMGT